MSQKSKQQNKQAATEKVRVAFTAVGWEQFEYWRNADEKIHIAIVRLIEECCRTPFDGLGKPEALRGDLSGYWSRRITKEHRFVYCVTGGVLQVISCRYHY